MGHRQLKAIIWDFGQVAFFFPKQSWLGAWSKLPRVRESLADMDPEDVKKRIALRQREFETGLTTVDGHRLALSKTFGLKRPLSWKEFRLGYLMSEKLVLNKPLFSAQASISAVGISQAVISNLCPVWEQVMRRAGATRHLDHELYSHSEGMLKPSAELVTRALDRLAVAAEEAVVIDDLEDNLRAAEECGANTYLYRGNPELGSYLAGLGLPFSCWKPLLTEPPTPFTPEWEPDL